MPKLGLTLYVAFLAVALGWRSWLQYRRTGDHGFRGLARPVGSIAWYGGAALSIGVGSAVLAPLAELAGLVVPWPALESPWAHLVGMLTAMTGIALTVLAQLQMGKAWRIGVDPEERTALVTDGLFQYVRNPIFLGMLLSMAGLVLLVPNPIALGALALSLIGIEIQVRKVEEPYLVRAHGERYVTYARDVGRLFPGVGRFYR
jgi:protein-S-isoprenylcysteine O-methyltransferase Ste14